MILAVFTKNKPKDKWILTSVAKDIETAKKHSNEINAQAKKFGYSDVMSTIQSYASIYDVPKTLDNVKPETLLYN